MRHTITAQEQLDWQSSLVCKFTEHLIPYSLLASAFYLVTVLFIVTLVFLWWDQCQRYKAVINQRLKIRGR